MRVTQSEFTQLVTEKEKLQAQIKESCKAQNKALKASKKALEELQVARARKKQLRQQIDLLDHRAEEAISIEERSIAEQELDKGTITFNSSSEGITLLPST
jgi:uncharacterized protein (DUF3084 family)